MILQNVHSHIRWSYPPFLLKELSFWLMRQSNLEFSKMNERENVTKIPEPHLNVMTVPGR